MATTQPTKHAKYAKKTEGDGFVDNVPGLRPLQWLVITCFYIFFVYFVYFVGIFQPE